MKKNPVKADTAIIRAVLEETERLKKI